MPLQNLTRPIPVNPPGAAPVIAEAPDFAAAARAVLHFLHGKLGFDLWMVTRTEGNDWIVLQAEDHGYGVAGNTVFRWTDSFCSQMIAGLGPRIAPQSDAVPAYAAAPIGRQVRIGAYVGVPLTYSDGTLFGTLCAIHPTPKLEVSETDLPLVELFATILSSLLNAEIKASAGERRAERAREDAETDALTGLFNRRGWDRLVAAEEDRCARFGHPASVIAIDLDGLKQVNDARGHEAGDDLIVRAGKALRSAVRDIDVVARTGGDEFLVLGVECDSSNATALMDRISEQLWVAGVSASLGCATRTPGETLSRITADADQAMYRQKGARKSARAASA